MKNIKQLLSAQKHALKSILGITLTSKTNNVLPANLEHENTPPLSSTVSLDLEQTMLSEFPDVAEISWQATNEILELLPAGNYEKLAIHSPGLAGYDWTEYIRLSVLRVARICQNLRKYGQAGQSVLDFGSYFGNFSIASKLLGFEVDALDTYLDYSPAFEKECALLKNHDIEILDSSGNRNLLDQRGKQYDFILLLGVIEHIPHSPKGLLEHVLDQLKPGGHLMLDTPNIAYIYRREAAAAGLSVHPSIKHQFDTELPFEGHHREYTCNEIHWMLERVGLEILEDEVFNYSLYHQKELTGADAAHFEKMRTDPSLREVIFCVAHKNIGSH